jgi:AbrB family looped-hinge helix DNA binding protein
MKVTSKGQVTIPKAIRDEFGLLPGTEVEFVRKGGDVRVQKVEGSKSRGREIVEHMQRPGAGGDNRLTTEEIMRMTRGEDWGTGRLEEDESGDAS